MSADPFPTNILTWMSREGFSKQFEKKLFLTFCNSYKNKELYMAFNKSSQK